MFLLKCSQRNRKQKNNLHFVLPDSLQRRSTQAVTPLSSSSALMIPLTRKDFMSVSLALSSRTRCTPASDQRGPQGAEAKREGRPGKAILTLGNLRLPRWTRPNRTAARLPTAPPRGSSSLHRLWGVKPFCNTPCFYPFMVRIGMGAWMSALGRQWGKEIYWPSLLLLSLFLSYFSFFISFFIS